MPDSNTLTQQISALFREKLHLQVPSPDTDLIDTGLVDSLTFVEFLAQLEQEFGVHLSLDDLELDRFRTVTRIAAFVATKSRNGSTLSRQE
jgi:methoxymalonate biosynthesis acyl carrier protein